MKGKIRLGAILTLALTASLFVGATGAEAALAGDDDNVVNIKLFTYRPNDFVGITGETITVNNLDGQRFGEPHSLTAYDGSFDTGVFFDVAQFTVPAEPGRHKFFCTVHPFMKGVLRVRPG
jgi:plastocyanin